MFESAVRSARRKKIVARTGTSVNNNDLVILISFLAFHFLVELFGENESLSLSLSLCVDSCLRRENTKRRLNTIERGDKAEEVFEHDWQRESFHFIPSEDRRRLPLFFSFFYTVAQTRTRLSVRPQPSFFDFSTNYRSLD